MIVIDLVYNLFVLVALSVLSGFIDKHYDRKTLTGKILQGVLFGLIAVIGMTYPYILTQGIIFDGRSIVISLCTVFFGLTSGVIASVLAIAYRLNLGGSGVTMGISVITASFLIGYVFNYFRFHKQLKMNSLTLYFLGVLVHLAMITLMFTLPPENWKETFRVVLLTVIVIYPLITLLIGKVLRDQEEKSAALEKIKQSEKHFRLLVQNSHDLLVKLDGIGNILYVSPAIRNILGYEPEEQNGNSVFHLVHPDYLPMVKMKFEELLLDPSHIVSGELNILHKNGSWKFCEVIGQNFLNDEAFNGIVVNTRDIGERKKNEEALLHKIDELQRFHRISINRELEMIALKKEINALLNKSGGQDKYKIAD